MAVVDYRNMGPEPDSYILPFLYAMDKKNKRRVWKIWATGPTVYKIYGEVDGAKITSERTYQGVNIGKANETSAEEQAKREAERDWIKQLDKCYLPLPGPGDDLAKRVLEAKKKQGGVNVNVFSVIRGETLVPKALGTKTSPKVSPAPIPSGTTLAGDKGSPILPMHCQPWSDVPKVLKYFDFDSGVYIQPKLDGIRCLAQVVETLVPNPQKGFDSNVSLLTRKGKQFVWLNHLRKEVQIFLVGASRVILDCEVYADVIYGISKGKTYSYTKGDPELPIEQRFDVISGAARPVRKEPHPLEGQLGLYVFDIIILGANGPLSSNQTKRFEVLDKLFSRPQAKKCPHIKRVDTKLIYAKEDIEDYHDEVAAQGYEGVVLRSPQLQYESNRRSLMMRKYKYFVEEEYLIVGVTCDSGVDSDQFCWVCKTDADLEFKAKPMGTREQKIDWYENSEDYIGKLLTVKYQKSELLEDDGAVPRFPIGKGIRDYE